MAHKLAASPLRSRLAGVGPGAKITHYMQWPLRVRMMVAAVSILALVAIVAFGVTREPAATTPAPAASRLGATPPKPAFTRAEDAYILALWPIHGDVERSTVRLSLGKIFYKTNDLGKAELKARVDAALATYRRAEAAIDALQPPPSLARSHEDYLAAVRLFAQSALEVLKMFDDGNDDHLLAAYPLSLEGSNKIREIGVRFWQDEFPAN